MIENREVTVSQKVYKTMKEIVRRINDHDYEYEYSPKKANHAIEFIENFCKHSKGKLAGKPFVLEIWQKAIVATTFGFVHKTEDYRMVKEIALIITRKHGKSTLGSAMGLYMLAADGEMGAEVVSAATKKDQAKIIWEEARRMIKKSPVLNNRIKCLVSELKLEATESTFKPLSSDSNSLDGLNVHCSLIDELHAIKDKNLYDVIVDGMSAREQPLSIITTTAGTVREGIFDIKYQEFEDIIRGYDDGNYRDDRVIAFIYELDSEEEWTDEACWEKANPALGTIKDRDELARKVQKAMKNPVLRSNLLCKDFNVRQNSEQAWLTFEQADNKETFDLETLKPTYAIGGVDLSQTTDLTAACFGFMLPNNNRIYFEHMYWLPSELLEQRVKEDNVPYDVWYQQGYLRLCEGNSISYKDITNWFLEMQGKYGTYMYLIGYDAWSARYFVEDMEDNFGKNTMVPVSQYAKTLSLPMQELHAKIKSKEIIYNNNPITKWCLMNTAVVTDSNGNIKPNKGKNQKRRIDGLAAMLDAFVVMSDNRAEYIGLIN
ncbi:terminase large subunit [Lysinibacillus capsici]|uniref:terminase large subunit n=1 Tax=Lysinibacillus capsici TaxID=2115968 RepID=UPI001FC98525|nr:terminase TerL endonuclease subunit [Lysinibacillus capsici]